MESQPQPPWQRQWWRWSLGAMMLWVLFLGVGMAFILQTWSRAQKEWAAALAAEKQAINRALADHRAARATARRAAQEGAIAQAAGYRVAMPPPRPKPADPPPADPEPTPESVASEPHSEAVSPPESPRQQLERLRLEQRRLDQEIQRLEDQIQHATPSPEP